MFCKLANGKPANFPIGCKLKISKFTQYGQFEMLCPHRPKTANQQMPVNLASTTG